MTFTRRTFAITLLLLVGCFGLNAQTCTYNPGPMTFTGTCTDGAFTDLVFPNNSNSVDATQFLDLTGVTISLGSNCNPTFSSMAATDSGTNFDFNAASINVMVTFGDGSNLTFNKNGDPSLGDLNGSLAECDAPCTLGQAALILPVELIRFTAVREGKSVKLSWATETETNNEFYVPERSADGTFWEALPAIEGAGTSGEISEYVTYDLAPLIGTIYYRIKQIDYDGRFSYSPLRSVIVAELNLVFPNPTNGLLNVETVGTVTITDLSGRELLKTTGLIGNNATTLDLSELSPGMYLVRTDSGVQKVLKR